MVVECLDIIILFLLEIIVVEQYLLVIETLITAAPQPHMNSLKSLLLSRSNDFNVTFGDVTCCCQSRFQQYMLHITYFNTATIITDSRYSRI
ncbi:hypothetical protein V1478_013062 [Vespula squamosa]|uniref:Secreted protein n=1 Tax=Vespula squamosa TaxID=30214 RepID=A0ABD2A9R1_VESSQ